jgi:hypothetical protein
MPCHKYFLQLRHKHIAHDQNAYSQALPGAIINGPAEPYKVAKIVSTAFHVESLNRDDYKKLFNLVRRAIQYTEEQIDLLCNQITEQLQKRIA